MTKRLIYLQSGFWDKIRKCDSVEDKRLFWDLYGALECSNIKTDILSDEWAEDKDDLLYYLLQSSYDGNGTKIGFCATDFIYDALDFTKEQPVENLCAAFLLDAETRECKVHSEELGVLCLNAKTIKEHRFVRGDAVMYEKGETYDRFEKCKTQLASPCNSMILIDPYILSTKRDVELSLIPLLDRCLPPDPVNQDNQKIEFHLSILSQTNGCKEKYKEDLRFEEIYDYVLAEIKKIRPKLRMKFSLYHTNTTGNGDGDFHSRHLLTNCMLVNSEDGFNYFENKRNQYTKKWETISGKHARLEFLYPTLIDNRRLDADNYYRWIKLSANNGIDNPLCWGDKENRLFELVD
jgi:hypothetical protein